ncbi:hypothetical protein C2G38_2055060 [Gigaspora rosea]|uniref:Uncharacterized protein n=1 Tax=Gigaspora rosea TaxID=44941 RepID=A0A397W7P8_9GLOM|nr:hypothetical protein C2G38_2055060 [Gigaspora rosea]
MSKNHTFVLFLATLLLLYFPIYMVCTPLFVSESKTKDHDLWLLDHFVSVSTKDKHPPHRPPHRPPDHPPTYPPLPKPKRAYVKFNDPPDVIKGVVVFWETPSNKTIIVGQFSDGFSEGDEKEYTFKVYNETSELVDLKPKDDTLDKIFKIRSNGSTDPFLFVFDDPLVTGNDSVIGNYLVVGRPGSLLGKSLIHGLLSCN